MKKIDLLEEMKRQILRLIETNEFPAKIEEKFNYYRDQLKDIIAHYNKNSESALEYIDMNFRYIESMLLEIKDKRLDNQAYGVMAKCRKMQMKIEEEILEDKNKEKEQDKEDFSEIICLENRAYAGTLIEGIQDYIMDVANRAKRILCANEYSERVIEEQEDEIRYLISKLKSRGDEEEIKDVLDSADKELLGKILEVYEVYGQQVDMIDNKEENEQEDFRKLIQRGAPTQEQQLENSRKFLQKQDNRNDEISQSLSSDIIL